MSAVVYKRCTSAASGRQQKGRPGSLSSRRKLSSPVVRACERAEALLPRCVPYCEFEALALLRHVLGAEVHACMTTRQVAVLMCHTG